MTGDLGKLLVCIDNAVVTVFGDDAYVTHIVPSSEYKDKGILLVLCLNGDPVPGVELDHAKFQPLTAAFAHFAQLGISDFGLICLFVIHDNSSCNRSMTVSQSPTIP